MWKSTPALQSQVQSLPRLPHQLLPSPPCFHFGKSEAGLEGSSLLSSLLLPLPRAPSCSTSCITSRELGVSDGLQMWGGWGGRSEVPGVSHCGNLGKCKDTSAGLRCGGQLVPGRVGPREAGRCVTLCLSIYVRLIPEIPPEPG